MLKSVVKDASHPTMHIQNQEFCADRRPQPRALVPQPQSVGPGERGFIQDGIRGGGCWKAD